jgi:fatty-acyl-CoA synthase
VVTPARSLTDRLVELAAAQPRATAVHDESGSATYRELVEAAARVASGLAGRGLPRGARVALAMQPSAVYVAATLGVLLAGGVPVPVNTRLTVTEATTYLNPLGPVLVLTDQAYAGFARELGPEVVLASGAGAPAPLLDRLTGLLGDDALHVDVSPDEPAIVFPTGGTTGLPKGAWYSHRGLGDFCRSVVQAHERTPEDVEIYFSPFFHVSLCTGLFTTLHAGGTTDILRSFDAEAALAAVARGGNRLMGSPTMFVALRTSPSFAATDRSGVRSVAFGSTDATGPFVEALRRDYPNARLRYGYGATEYGPVTSMPHEVLVAGTRSGVGRPNDGVALRVLDEQGEDVAAGQVGELAVRCSWEAEGYWGRPAETASTFTDAGVRLGDLGRIDAEGWVHIAGRSKEMIITGGENVFPVEVEGAFAHHGDVQEVCVYGVTDEYWGERVEAAVVPVAGRALDLEALLSHARARLAGYKVPKRVLVVDALPLTPNNKPDRRALRAAAEARVDSMSWREAR